jgi:lysozyme family protein
MTLGLRRHLAKPLTTSGSKMTAQTDFERSMKHLMEFEGTRYENHPKDPGGPTKFGVTIGDVKRFIDPCATAATVKALTYEQAAQVYKMHYWRPMHCDELEWPINFLIFDMGVNAGPSRSIKIAQHALGVDADGVIGEITLAALKQADSVTFARDFSEGRRRFYRSLSTFSTFGKGWLNRVNASEKYALGEKAAKAKSAFTMAGPAKAIRPESNQVSKQGAAAQVAGKAAAVGSGAVILDSATGLMGWAKENLDHLAIWRSITESATSMGTWAMSNWRVVSIVVLAAGGWWLYRKGKSLITQGLELYMSHSRDI